MRQAIGCGLFALCLTACSTPQRASHTELLPTSVAALSAAIAEDARRSDHESNSTVRGDLAADAIRDADACLAQAPQSAACLYGRGVAQGLEARSHPTRAGELLNAMLESLARAEATDPNYDHAGPARVRALVLVRAPGWPLGPGDPDAGLAAARRAADLEPAYPPNWLALAEALAKTGDPNGARDNYRRARDAALALPATAERAGWLSDATQALGAR